MKKDNLFAKSSRNVGDFAFDDAVADVFPDMISRSVPGYGSILAMIGELAEKYSQAETNIYDLGCSLGAATFLMSERVPESCRIVAVDNSPAMIRRIDGQIQARRAGNAVKIVTEEADVLNFELHNSSFVVLNLTLQFLPIEERAGLLRRVQESLVPGGALLLAEKFCFDDPEQQALLTELHHDFKRSHGYSELEIAQKRTAIENRLVPEKIETHLARLRDAGFQTVVPWFQCFNFGSILAIKN